LYQDSTRIHKEIREQQFFSNPALTEAVQLANDRQANVHIMGLLSDGGVHSHQDHIVAMVELALQQGAKQVFIHTFLDGRDTPPKSADNYVAQLQQALATLNEQYEGTAYLVSLIGRY
ncbi:2,3-bisphosphoglycerate-independent phosphoglycerate mutase, partial [Escherichia coli]|nr:2,3-bisphosphoglycerate-independent phosphoglycerate mutase [Escherichia coli]